MSLLEEEHEIEERTNYRVVNWPLAGLIGLWRFVVRGFWRCHIEFFNIEQKRVAAQMAYGEPRMGIRAWGRVGARGEPRIGARGEPR